MRLHQHMLQKEEHVIQLREHLLLKEENMEQLREDIQQKEEDMTQLRKLAHQESSTMKHVHSQQLERQDLVMQQKDRQLQQKDGQLEQKDRQLEEKDRQLQCKDNVIQEMRSCLEQIRNGQPSAGSASSQPEAPTRQQLIAKIALMYERHQRLKDEINKFLAESAAGKLYNFPLSIALPCNAVVRSQRQCLNSHSECRHSSS